MNWLILSAMRGWRCMSWFMAVPSMWRSFFVERRDVDGAGFSGEERGVGNDHHIAIDGAQAVGIPVALDDLALGIAGLERASRIEHRLRQLPFAGEATDKQFNYRIQLLAAARGGLGSTQRRQVEKLFQEARIVLCEQFIEPKPLEVQ